VLVTLAKALKIKNRQTASLATLQRKVSANNSYLVGSEPDFDSKAAYEELQEAIDRLVETKSKINEANAPIQPVIYRMAELKGLVKFVRSLNTHRGKVLTGFTGETPLEYAATIDAIFVESEIERIEREIDDLQDRLDAHNAQVRIELDV
jgi:hypothetical protein